MKIIFSRKGFDSSSGRLPSPILPDGRIISLPIPDKTSGIKYSDITYDEFNIGNIVFELSKEKIPPHFKAHVDPDLRHDAIPRQAGWKPIFGQMGASQGHLKKQNVQADDIFLFFGLFKRTAIFKGILQFDKSSSAFHCLWGWLQIGAVLPIHDALNDNFKWAHYHPHFNKQIENNNILYISRDNLKINGKNLPVSGAGVFSQYSHTLQLTVVGQRNTKLWNLPLFMFPEDEKDAISYHQDKKRWHKDEKRAFLSLVSRGQEFVWDTKEQAEPLKWIEELITQNQSKRPRP